MELRPTTSLRIRFNPNINWGTSSGQYVQTVADPLATNTFGNRYVFAELDQTTISMDTRVEWTFTPTLSLQMYAQPFVATGRYENFKELARRAATIRVYEEIRVYFRKRRRILGI